LGQNISLVGNLTDKNNQDFASLERKVVENFMAVKIIPQNDSLVIMIGSYDFSHNMKYSMSSIIIMAKKHDSKCIQSFKKGKTKYYSSTFLNGVVLHLYDLFCKEEDNSSYTKQDLINSLNDIKFIFTQNSITSSLKIRFDSVEKKFHYLILESGWVEKIGPRILALDEFGEGFECNDKFFTKSIN